MSTLATMKPDFAKVRDATLADIAHARARLSVYALATDEPEHGVVEAADALDRACEALEGAP